MYLLSVLLNEFNKMNEDNEIKDVISKCLCLYISNSI